MFQKELTLIKQVNQKNVCFAIIGILKTLVKCQPYVCNAFHAMSIMAYKSKNIVILNAEVVDYRRILWGISKNDVIDSLNNSLLEDKGVL